MFKLFRGPDAAHWSLAFSTFLLFFATLMLVYATWQLSRNASELNRISMDNEAAEKERRTIEILSKFTDVLARTSNARPCMQFVSNTMTPDEFYDWFFKHQASDSWFTKPDGDACFSGANVPARSHESADEAREANYMRTQIFDRLSELSLVVRLASSDAYDKKIIRDEISFDPDTCKFLQTLIAVDRANQNNPERIVHFKQDFADLLGFANNGGCPKKIE